MKKFAAVVLIALVATACSDNAEADRDSSACAPPIISVSPATVAPEGTLVITGEEFFEGCDDVGEVRDGETVFEELPPQTGVVVTADSGSQEWELGTVDANSDGAISLEVDLPAEMSEGRITVKAGDAEPATVSIVRD